MKTYILGYGSLINEVSAGKALQRDISLADFVPVILKGYKRTWTLREQVYSEKLSKNVTAAFLNLTATPHAWVNGVLFEVNEEEHQRLKSREKNYNEVDITSSIHSPAVAPMDDNIQVLTFIAKPEFQVTQSEDEVYVMEKYIKLVTVACSRLGPQFLDSYNVSTEEISFPILEGNYTFLDQEQIKYV